jgi:hypothetical protein
LAELDEILGSITERSPKGQSTVCCIATPRYPGAISYEAIEDEIIIVGPRHGARDPSGDPA